MNPHELRFRRPGRTLTLLIGLWVGLMVAAAALAKWFPGVKSNLAYVLFAFAFFALFVAIFIIGVLRMIAYLRWTLASILTTSFSIGAQRTTNAAARLAVDDWRYIA
jgi:CBS domain containing-hemolysin-like protein